MKQFYWSLFLGFIISTTSFAAAEAIIKIDLKVELLETADLGPAQLGTTLFLMRSDWATVTDMGEDVAVWLTGYERHRNLLGQQVIRCDLEIRDPSFVRSGNLQQRETVTIRYWPHRHESSKYEQEILNDLHALSEELKIEGYLLGKKISKRLEQVLK